MTLKQTFPVKNPVHGGLVEPARWQGRPSRHLFLRNLGASLILAASSVQAVLINDVDFSYVYDGSASPTNPPWSTPLANGSGISDGNVFTIATTAAENRYYLMTAGTGIPWNAGGDEGSTIEFRIKIEEQASGADAAAYLTVTNGSRNFSFTLTDEGVLINGGPLYEMNTSVFNVFRLTLTGSGATATMNVYLNNDPTPIIQNFASSAANTNNRIYFGDPSNSVGGITQWDYIAFTNDGAYAPVPEPGTAMLLGLGLAILGWRARRINR